MFVCSFPRFASLVAIVVFVRYADATAQGAVKMDNYTFDKVLGLPGYSVLVKFDQSYAYGDKEDQFKELCKMAYNVSGFLVGEVPVQEYGDKENDDLRERFGLKKDDFPVYFLFKGPEDKTKYEGKITADDLASWLRRKGVKMPSIGTIADLDEIAKKFLKAGAESEITAAETLANGQYKNDRKAGMYVKIMKKIKEKGAAYVDTEIARIEKIMKGKLTEDKVAELNDKMKVLNVFGIKEEL